MEHLFLSHSLLPLAMTIEEAGNWIVYVIGWIAIVLVVILLLCAIPMIPDFIRYLKIKSM